MVKIITILRKKKIKYYPKNNSKKIKKEYTENWYMTIKSDYLNQYPEIKSKLNKTLEVEINV